MREGFADRLRRVRRWGLASVGRDIGTSADHIVSSQALAVVSALADG